jgi:hypothetical protein
MAGDDDAGRRLDELLDAVESRLDRLEASIDDEPDPAPAAEAAEPAEPGHGSDDHVLFVPSPAGYTLVERRGQTPSRGDAVELLYGERYVVVKVARATSPDDRRPCVFLERAP